MKLATHAILTAALLAFAGCTTDDGYDGCHGVGCMVDDPDASNRTINTAPQFDRTGCHGIGCMVDDPDAGDQTIDDRPQYDDQGNPNFDTQGNYQGCHGIGCEVDTPDDEEDG